MPPDAVRGHAGSALSRTVSGRIAAIFFGVSGLVTALSPLLPSPEGQHDLGVLVIGLLAMAGGVFFLVVPWSRLPRWAMYLTMVVAADVLIAFHNYYGGLDPYRYTLFFCVLYCLIGLTQPRGRAALASPVTALAYVAPLVVGDRALWTMMSALYAVPVFVLIGESIAYYGARLAGSIDESRRAALTDVLTGLANRRAFYERLAEACRAERRGDIVGVVFVDLDGFKPVNDRHGHEYGDEILRVVARRLQTAVRSEDVVARLGGDEFAVLLHDLIEGQDAVRVAGRLVEAVQAPISVAGQAVHVGVSVGVATAPTRSVDPDELVRWSDQAMYRAKRSGGNVVVTHPTVGAA